MITLATTTRTDPTVSGGVPAGVRAWSSPVVPQSAPAIRTKATLTPCFFPMDSTLS